MRTFPELFYQLWTLNETSIVNLKIIHKESEKEAEAAKNEIEFVAFARVFSGQIKPGDEIFVLGPKYDPSVSAANLEVGKEDPRFSYTSERVSKKCFEIKVT